MGNRRKRRKFKIYHIIILFFVVYISMIVVNQHKLKKELLAKRNKVEQDISVLQSEIEDLNLELENKGTLEFLEDVAREELGMVKNNEIMYIDKGKYKNSIFNFFEEPND